MKRHDHDGVAGQHQAPDPGLAKHPDLDETLEQKAARGDSE
jgi:hypothetical protein